MYCNIKTLKMSSKSASRLKSMLESVTFLQVPDLHDITVSRRRLGAVGDEVTGKVNQAATLTVADVWHLHTGLCNSGTRYRVCMWGSIVLHLLPARWSDFTPGSSLRLDMVELTGRDAYADMVVQIHKTMGAAANRFKFLDLAASGTGIFGEDWTL